MCYADAVLDVLKKMGNDKVAVAIVLKSKKELAYLRKKKMQASGCDVENAHQIRDWLSFPGSLFVVRCHACAECAWRCGVRRVWNS